jgi:fructosamine-3-kinase
MGSGGTGDGYLGRVVQHDPWTANGHEFFAQHRVLRYLDEPLVQQELTRAAWRARERFCDRLTEIVPAIPAVLTHGDLWQGNLLSQADGRITAIDPAVSYTWAEVDLSMLWGCQRSRCQSAFQPLPGTKPLPAGLGRAYAAAPSARTAEQHGPPRQLRRQCAPPTPYPRPPSIPAN